MNPTLVRQSEIVNTMDSLVEKQGKPSSSSLYPSSSSLYPSSYSYPASRYEDLLEQAPIERYKLPKSYDLNHPIHLNFFCLLPNFKDS